jgi:hypothetical protein
MPAWRLLQLLSTVALVAGVVLLVAGSDAGWWLLIASGALFAAEVVVRLRAPD